MGEIVMPRLSDSMEEGTILKWLRADGDEVARGDELVEIETDKATMTYEADQGGVLEIVASEGDTLPIGEVIARIGGGGDGGGKAEEQQESSEDGKVEEHQVERETRGQTPTPREVGNGDPARVKASPVARRMARELSVDLASLTGSGPGGRIVKSDVEAAADGAPAGAAESEAAATPTAPVTAGEPGGSKGEVTVQELTRTQTLIARRMAESKATIPEFVLQMDIDMEAAVSMREQLKDTAGDAPVPSLNDFVVKACGLALREFPRVNGSYRDGRFELHSRVNVGVAVATEEALVVPTVFDADSKSLGGIAKETRALAQRVRDASITPPELSGGTFTVSNLGMFGVTSFTAVINPPQAAILAVGVVELRPAVHEGQIAARHRMSVALGCDHRILYGADAARFLARVRELLEKPVSLVL